MSGRPPDEATLYEAGLNHLARYPATELSMARVLGRKVDRWARGCEGEAEEALRGAKGAIPGVIARLKEAGVLSDSAFAESRAKRLRREGKSRRYAVAHLAAKGVAMVTAQSVVSDEPEKELAAACVFLRRKKAGPFGEAPELKVLAAMGRMGFSQEVARRAMRLERDEAEALVARLED